METYKGTKIYDGIAIGNIFYYKKRENCVERKRVEDTEAEVNRYEQAKKKAIDQLNVLHEKAVVEVGEINAQIIEVHAMMLEDDDYNDSIHNLIRNQGINAECAVVLRPCRSCVEIPGMPLSRTSAPCPAMRRTTSSTATDCRSATTE